MTFTTPCFVRVEDPAEREKLIEWLEEIGYHVCSCCKYDGWNTLDCGPVDRGDVTFEVHGVPDNDEESGYNVELFKYENSHKEHPAYDCGDNIDCFRALAAMNDENDREQWFVVLKRVKVIDIEYNDEFWIYDAGKMFFNDVDQCLSKEFFRKATADEIVKYFKKR